MLYSTNLDWNSWSAVTIPLKVAATFVKLAIPPPMINTCNTQSLSLFQSHFT
jgi:hypothetical protein